MIVVYGQLRQARCQKDIMMDDSRLVRYELTIEEAGLLVDLLKEHVGKTKDDDVLHTLLARLQRAEDHAVNRMTVRGPANDEADYEW